MFKLIERNGETETLSSEIPQASYLNLHRQKLVLGDSPLSRVSLRSEYSPSSSFSNGFCSSEDSSPFSTPFEETKYQTPSTHYMNGLWLDSKSPESHFKKKINNEKLEDDLGLCGNLYRLHIRDEGKGSTKMGRFEMDPDGFGSRFVDGSLGLNGNIPYNVEKCNTYDGFYNGAFCSEGFQCLPRGVSSSFDDDMSTLLGLRGGHEESNSKGSSLAHNLSNNLCFNTPWYKNQGHYLFEQRNEEGRTWAGGIQLQNQASINGPYFNDAFVHAQQGGVDFNGDRGVIDPLSSSELMNGLALNMNNALHSRSLLKEMTLAMPNNRVPQSLMSVKDAGNIEAFSSEDSLIIEGKSLEYAINKGHDLSKAHKYNSASEIALHETRQKSSKLDNHTNHGGACENGQSLISDSNVQLLPSLNSLAKVQGSIYFMAKDQNGCRFLQRIFDEGTFLDVLIIFSEIIDHVIELMIDPFGNYLVQKLLAVCSEEQRMQIVFVVTKEPGQLVRISLNTYGTRVVQKLVETLKTRQQSSLLQSALKPGFLDLIKDLSGNHVIQRCLQCLSTEDNKFIFDAAMKFCVDIATHRHGCCVLQRCIAHSISQQRDKLISEISRNGLLLAQDPFGNYVVQYVIELKIPSAIALLSQFKGHYVHLSMQKFSSHVVEKCLKHFGESRSQIIREFLSVSHFEQLLQDPFANYVIQSALAVTKGLLHASLVEAVRPHAILRTSPYCKRIFSRNLLKK